MLTTEHILFAWPQPPPEEFGSEEGPFCVNHGYWRAPLQGLGLGNVCQTVRELGFCDMPAALSVSV